MNNNNKSVLDAIRAHKALKDSKDAKPEGDKVKAFNNALTYAKKENKPFIYGYTNRDGKFFALDNPMKVSVSPVDAEKEFRKRYKNCSVVYFAYPDKEFIKDEQMSEDYIPHGVDLINGEYDPTIPSDYYGPKRSYFTYKGINVYKTGNGYGSYTISGFDKKATYYLTNIKQVKDFINNHLHVNDSLKDEKIDVEKELLANHFEKRKCKPGVNGNDICYYDYKGTGYFPEVVARLQNKLGKFDYVGETNRIVGIKHKDEKLLDENTHSKMFEPNDYSTEFTQEEIDEFLKTIDNKTDYFTGKKPYRKKKVFVDKKEREKFIASLPEEAEVRVDEFEHVWEDENGEPKRWLVYWEVYYYDVDMETGEVKDAVELSRGEQLAKAVAKAFKGQCGPFGGENPFKHGNKVGLHSQAGVTWYIFNDDGSVDVEPDDETISLAEEDGEEITTHYNSADELFNGEDGWFYDAPSSLEKQFREILKTSSNVKDSDSQDYWELVTSSSKSANFDTEEEAREVLEEDRQRAIKMLKESKLKNHYAYEFICKYEDDELEDYNIGYLLIKINGVVKDYTHDYGYDLDLYDADEQIEEIIDNLVEETSSNVKDSDLYIYQFPASMTKEDMKEAKKYGLEILGKVGENGFQPGDWIIQGTLKQLEKFCDESLGYVMHPDYLYKSKEFDIEDVLVKDEALGEVQVDEFAEEEPNVSKKIEHQGKWTKYEINGQEMTVEQFLEEYDAGNLPELDAIYPESGGFKIPIEEVRKLPKDTMGRFTIYDEIEEDDEFGPFTRRSLWFLIEGI